MSSTSVRFLETMYRVLAQHKNSWLAIAVVMSIAACSTTVEISDNELNSKFANLTAAQALALTTDHYNKAISEQYDYYSPVNWQEASTALSQAQTIAKQDPASQEILKHVYVVDRRLESAQYVKNSVQKQYGDLFESQRMLIENAATQSYAKEFQETETQLAKHIRDFEDLTLGRNKDTVSQRSINIGAHTLLSNMRALNIKVVKYNFLHQAQQDLAGVEQLDAKNIAPKTYKQALSALAAANEYIEANVHDKDGIRQAADAFRFSVDHVAHVTQAIVELSKKDVKQLEDVVLENEQHLHAIAQSLGNNDVRNLPLDEQSRAIVNTANGMLRHHTEKSSMIVDLSEQNLILQSELKNLQQNQDGSAERLKLKVTALEQEIIALEKEREKLKDNVFALQQKNIDLAIQNAKLTNEVERMNGASGDDKNSGRHSSPSHAADTRKDSSAKSQPVSYRNQAVYSREQ